MFIEKRRLVPHDNMDLDKSSDSPPPPEVAREEEVHGEIFGFVDGGNFPSSACEDGQVGHASQAKGPGHATGSSGIGDRRAVDGVGQRKKPTDSERISRSEVLNLLNERFGRLESLLSGGAQIMGSSGHVTRNQQNLQDGGRGNFSARFPRLRGFDRRQQVSQQVEVDAPVMQLDSPEDMGSLAGSPVRSWRPQQPMRTMVDDRSESPGGRDDLSVDLGFDDQCDDGRSTTSDPADRSKHSFNIKDPDEAVPSSWVELMDLTKSILKLPNIDDPVVDIGQSVLASSFTAALPAAKKGVILQPDAIIKASWDQIFKSTDSSSSSGSVSVTKKLSKIPAFKKRHKEQYRWPEQDFVHLGKPQDVDGAVMTYIASGLAKSKGQGQFFPRKLYPEEVVADSSLKDIDYSLRTSHRVISHCSYFLAGLSTALQTKSALDVDVNLLLSGIATSLCDIADLSVRDSAKCVKVRREIYLKAMNLPDKQAKNDLLKVSPLGDKLFAGQVEKITHSSSEIVRDIRETARNYGVLSSNPQSRGPKRKNSDDFVRPAAKKAKPAAAGSNRNANSAQRSNSWQSSRNSQSANRQAQSEQSPQKFFGANASSSKSAKPQFGNRFQ